MIPSIPASSACSPSAIPEEWDSKKAGAMKIADAQALIQKSALSEVSKQEILASSLLLEHIRDFYPAAECILQSALAGPDQYRCLSSVKEDPFNLIDSSILEHIWEFRDEAELVLASSLKSEDKTRCLSCTTAWGENVLLGYIRDLRPEAEWLLASTLSSRDKAAALSFTTSRSATKGSPNAILQHLRDFPLTYLFPLFIDAGDSSQRYLRLSTRHEQLQAEYQSHPFRPVLEKLLICQLPAQEFARWLSSLNSLSAPVLAPWKDLPDQVFVQWILRYWNTLSTQQRDHWTPHLQNLPALIYWLTQAAPALNTKSPAHPSRPVLNLDVLAHIAFFSFPFLSSKEVSQLHILKMA